MSHPDQHLAESRGVEAAFFLVNVTSHHLRKIAALVDSRQVKTHLGAALPFADGREAHFMLEHIRPQPKGKIVLATNR